MGARLCCRTRAVRLSSGSFSTPICRKQMWACYKRTSPRAPGRLRAFTFIDPTDNMLASSSVLASSLWLASPTLKITGGMPDPDHGVNAFALTNSGQKPCEPSTNAAHTGVLSILPIDVCGRVRRPHKLVSFAAGPTVTQVVPAPVGPTWTRIVANGQLADPGMEITTGLSLDPGHSITVYGMQLEAQSAPSSYRPTFQNRRRI